MSIGADIVTALFRVLKAPHNFINHNMRREYYIRENREGKIELEVEIGDYGKGF
jgi:hypothetical protein